MPCQSKKAVAKITKQKHAGHAEVEKLRPSPTALVNQLLLEASTEEERAKIIFNTLINTSETGQECNKIVAIVNEKAEAEESWNFLGLNKDEFYQQICYDSIVAPAVEAYRKKDKQKRNQAAFIEGQWGKDWRKAADPNGALLPTLDSERT